MPSLRSSFFLLRLLLLLVVPAAARRHDHVITFRSLDLYPESAAWDASAQHFVVGSVRRPSLHAVSDAGLMETLISDPDLPANVSVLGVAVDSARQRALAVVTAGRRFPPFDALAAYDLRSPVGLRRRIFLSPLSSADETSRRRRPIVNGIALDPAGNAFVTASLGNFIWKVDVQGIASVFSDSPIFTPTSEVSPNESYSWCGLNGIAYAASGYLLVVQTNTGKVFKVDGVDGRARLVWVQGRSLRGAEGIAIRGDGSAVVMSQRTAWLLKRNDGWSEAAVYDEVGLDEERFPTGVVVREGNQAYVLYGRANEGMMGKVLGREEFSLEELEWEKEEAGEYVWAFVLIGFGLCYFTYWRFQMGQLARKINKKTA